MVLRFEVKDDSNYRLCLYTKVDGQDVEFKLYSVWFWNPERSALEDSVMVLAENSDGALSQVACLLCKESYRIGKDAWRLVEERSIVRFVPFMIRGWGTALFGREDTSSHDL